jgi:hypothetical protein
MKQEKIQTDLVKLFYNFYVEVLELYKHHPPKFYTKDAFSYASEKNAITTFPQAFMFRSYYHNFKKVILEMPSFQKIIRYLEQYKEVLDTDLAVANGPNTGKKRWEIEGIDESFGGIVFSIVEDFFERHHSPKVKGLIQWKQDAVSYDDFDTTEQELVAYLCRKGRKVQEYYYLLENVKIESAELNISNNDFQLSLKQLTDEDKTLILNSISIQSRELHDKIYNINVALCSSSELKGNDLRRIFTALRLYKSGDFRICAVGVLINEDIKRKRRFEILPPDDWVGNPLSTRWWPLFTSGFEITEQENAEVKDFVESNLPKLSHTKFSFPIQCLCQIHSHDPEFRIPFLFFILEAFFDKIKQELTFRLKYTITKLLGESFQFSENLKRLYELRSKIVRGDKAGIKKIAKKIKNENGTPCKGINECAQVLENIMRRVWKTILSEELFREGIDIEEKYF